MTIQPLPDVVARSAEQRPGAGPDTSRQPLPDGWCYACGCLHVRSRRPDSCWYGSLPLTLRRWASAAAYQAIATPPVPVELEDWSAGDVEMARAVAAVLTEWAGTAERLIAQRRETEQ